MSRTTAPAAIPTPAAPAASAPWEELVTSALLGTDRRPPEGASATGPDGAAAALLDAAALHTV
ncbi:hypothetical protein G3I41_23240, partial [Streptomyces sp. SID9727]|nr:hypothetical protein [Streptomyces sp. SID9727]